MANPNRHAGEKLIATNKQARRLYEFLETLEAGLVLMGSELKSLREGRVNFMDGYVRFSNNEAWLTGVHIAPYANAGYVSQEPDRARKLLLHEREIRKLIGKLHEKGIALIPLKIYFVANGKAKVELGLARGKKLYDKRAALKEKQSSRDMERSLRRDD